MIRISSLAVVCSLSVLAQTASAQTLYQEFPVSPSWASGVPQQSFPAVATQLPFGEPPIPAGGVVIGETVIGQSGQMTSPQMMPQTMMSQLPAGEIIVSEEPVGGQILGVIGPNGSVLPVPAIGTNPISPRGNAPAVPETRMEKPDIVISPPTADVVEPGTFEVAPGETPQEVIAKDARQSEYEERISLMAKRIDDSDAELKTMKAELDKSKSELLQSNLAKAELTLESKRVNRAAIDAAKKLEGKLAMAAAAKTKAEGVAKDLEEQLAKTKAKANPRKKNLAATKKLKAELAQAKADAEQARAKLVEVTKASEAAAAASEKEMAELKARVTQLSSSMAKMKTKADEAQKAYAAAEKNQAANAMKLKDLSSVRKQLVDKNREMLGLREELELAQAKLKKTRDSKVKKDADAKKIASLTASLGQLETEKGQLTSKISGFMSQMAASQKEKAKLAKASAEADKLRAETSKMRTSSQAMSKKLGTADAMIKKLKRENEVEEKATAKAKSELAVAKKDSEELKSKLVKAEKRFVELTKKKDEAAEMGLSELRKEFENAKMQEGKTAKKLASREKSLMQLKKLIDSEEKNAEKLQAKLAEQKKDYQKQINELDEQFKASSDANRKSMKELDLARSQLEAQKQDYASLNLKFTQAVESAKKAEARKYSMEELKREARKQRELHENKSLTEEDARQKWLRKQRGEEPSDMPALEDLETDTAAKTETELREELQLMLEESESQIRIVSEKKIAVWVEKGEAEDSKKVIAERAKAEKQIKARVRIIRARYERMFEKMNSEE